MTWYNAHMTQDELKAVVTYDPETGVFRWVQSKPGRRASVGAVLGARGYVQVCIDGKRYYAHRLAWLYVHGSWPTDLVDHINQDTTDNRIANLRNLTQAENLQNRGKNRNNTSGHRGVAWNKSGNCWHTRIKVGEEDHYLGSFKNLEDAVAARKAGEAKYHPFQAN